MNRWLSLVKALVPLIVGTIEPKLGPVIPNIANAINEAEELSGKKTGKEKLEHVKNIVKDAATIANNAAGRDVVDPKELDSAITNAVDTVVTVVNIIDKNKKPPVVPVKPVVK